MRLIILPLLLSSMNIAQAGVFKCPDPITGKLTYQSRPCNNQANSNDHKVRIAPSDEKRAKAAKEKLDLYMKQRKEKQTTQATPPPTEINVTLPAQEKTTVTKKATPSPTDESSPVTEKKTAVTKKATPSPTDESSPVTEKKTPPVQIKTPPAKIILDNQPESTEELSNKGS